MQMRNASYPANGRSKYIFSSKTSQRTGKRRRSEGNLRRVFLQQPLKRRGNLTDNNKKNYPVDKHLTGK